jgi:hypothetical protein
MLLTKSRKTLKPEGTILQGGHSPASATIDEILIPPSRDAPREHESIKLCGEAIGKTLPQKKKTGGRAGDPRLAQSRKQGVHVCLGIGEVRNEGV